MKVKLTQQEQQQVELAALQKVVQDKIQNLIDARAEEMLREIGDAETTLLDLHKRFLGTKPIIDTQSAAKSLLVPAGVKI